MATGLHAPTQEVFFQVQDTGAGMPEEVMERIADPFFTTKRDTGGTGLGLSISHTIVEDHGGRMTFESQPGQGTTATVYLPVKGQNHQPEEHHGDNA